MMKAVLFGAALALALLPAAAFADNSCDVTIDSSGNITTSSDCTVLTGVTIGFSVGSSSDDGGVDTSDPGVLCSVFGIGC